MALYLKLATDSFLSKIYTPPPKKSIINQSINNLIILAF